jgi:hypothetical protein
MTAQTIIVSMGPQLTTGSLPIAVHRASSCFSDCVRDALDLAFSRKLQRSARALPVGWTSEFLTAGTQICVPHCRRETDASSGGAKEAEVA